MLKGKKILLGITGSIAAYKTAFLVRELVKKGAEVKVITSPSALSFVTPLTLSTLSKNPVFTEYSTEEGEWNNHVDLALWADIFVIAPASANTIAKMAHGLCDNLLLATYLSAKCPVFVAPAMDLDMYKHRTLLDNLKLLEKSGNYIIEAKAGELASGLIGQGRMEEPELIVDKLESHFKSSQVLEGKVALVTAGPTVEAIDPVRFISNYSSGKMGYAIAHNLAGKGAKVHLVSGPTNQQIHDGSIVLYQVKSAQEMYEQCLKLFEQVDILVFSAAVADYTPKVKADQKIKKADQTFSIELAKTKDIAQELGKLKKVGQIAIGFALETHNEEFNALEKLKSKNLDFVVLNTLNDKGAGFQLDTNIVTIIDKKGNKVKYDLKSKVEVAEDIVAKIVENI